MTPWDPDRYLGFADQRSRPGVDLINRVGHPSPETIVDLGCGTGHLTVALARRWPQARVIGVDTSPQMLERAVALFPPRDWPTVEWREEDLATFQPASPPSILFSNATLHWVPEHRSLFPRLMDSLAPGGVLAVQMPDNWNQPSHLLIGRLIDDPWWARGRVGDDLSAALVRSPLAAPGAYRAWLSPAAGDVDMWRTTYFHLLGGPDPVLGWVKGSVLAPVLAVLEPDDAGRLEAALAAAYREAYPPEPDGTTIFPFSRLFFVATKLTAGEER